MLVTFLLFSLKRTKLIRLFSSFFLFHQIYKHMFELDMNFKSFLGRAYLAVFTYSTMREARIQSWKLSLMFRLFQLGILSYIIGWSIVWKKGYQAHDTISSSVTTKVKGLGYIYQNKNSTLPKLGVINLNDSPIIFDTSDYVIPPLDYDSVTNFSSFILLVTYKIDN